MITTKILLPALFFSFLGTPLFADTTLIKDIGDVEGNWHLRVIDKKDVRKARAIFDFHPKTMVLEGFDGCNRFSGKLLRSTENNFFSKVSSTKMACRQHIHSYVSKRVNVAIKEGFTITEGTRYGIEGITLKSKHHDLFFKKMGGTGSVLDMLK